MEHYTASMKHNEDTIYRLSATQYNVFGGWTKVILLLLSGIWIYLGTCSNMEYGLKLLCLMVGCFFVTGINFPARWNAEKYLKQLNGKNLETEYCFDENSFSFCAPGDKKHAADICYSKIIRLVDDNRYIYLFLNKYGAYMLDKETLCPADIDAFQAMLQERTGLKWKKVKSKQRRNVAVPPSGTLLDKQNRLR